MKNKIAVNLGISGILFFCLIALLQWKGIFRPGVEIKPPDDNKAIFFGREFNGENDSIGLSEQDKQRVERHKADIEASDESRRFRVKASAFLKEGKLELAADAFEKAYSYKRHAVTSFDLAAVYEKLERYEDAITILDNMIKNREANEYGIQKANEIKQRLKNANRVVQSQY